MNHNPKVTVVTITYNLIHARRKDFFKQCIESVHNQSYGNIEHIVIDGASTDGTLDIIKQYADRGWLTYFSEKDDGIYEAMNKGIDKSNGLYINFLNSDDFFHHPDGMKLSVRYLLETKADYSFAKATLISNQGSYLGIYQPVIESFLFRMPFCHQTMLIKKDTMITLNKFDVTYNSAADFDFVLRLCISGAKFVKVPLNFVSFRFGGVSYVNQEQSISEYARSCINNLNKYAESDLETYRKMYTDLLMPKKLYKAIVPCLADEYKRRLIDLIENHSRDKGKYYKISKYTRPVDHIKTTLKTRLQQALHLLKTKTIGV